MKSKFEAIQAVAELLASKSCSNYYGGGAWWREDTDSSVVILRIVYPNFTSIDVLELETQMDAIIDEKRGIK